MFQIWPVVCACTTACLASEFLFSMGPAFICGFWLQNSVFWYRIIRLYGTQTSPVILCLQNRVIRTRKSILHESQPSCVVLRIQNTDFMTRITFLYGCQTSPVVLCMENNVISTRITSVYGSKSSLRHLSFCACKAACLPPDFQVSMGPRPHLWICAFKTAPLALEWQVYRGTSPHLWFLHAKQRL